MAGAFSANFHAPSVVSISRVYTSIQDSDTCLAGSRIHKETRLEKGDEMEGFFFIFLGGVGEAEDEDVK